MNDHTVLIPDGIAKSQKKESGDIAMDSTIMVASSDDCAKTVVDLKPSPSEKTVAITANRAPSRASQLKKKQGVSVGDCLKQRFELIDVLGIGGMGVVYRARDRRQKELGDKQPYLALKVLNDQLSDHEAALIALQQECKKAQKLAHPNIVNVYDFDRDDDVVYLTMELLHGESLDQIILRENHRARSYEEVLPWVKSIADALIYAHENHIVHSDLKPSNLFITDAGNLKIFDFGIARATHNSAQVNNEIAALTPAYASLGMLTKQPPKASDDLYAFAVVVYLLLAGKHPYGRKSADEVLRLGLTPKRPKSIPDTPWRVLQQALDPRRCEQFDVESFKDGFIPKPRVLSKGTLGIIAGVAFVVVGILFNWGTSYIENKDIADSLVSGSMDTVKQAVDQLSTFDSLRRSELLGSQRDLFIENSTRLMELKIQDEQYFQASAFSKYMLGIYPDSKILLELNDRILSQKKLKQQQYVDKIVAIETRLVGFSDELIEQWFYALERLRRVKPDHNLLDEERLLASSSIAVHALLFAGRTDTAEMLLDELSRFIGSRQKVTLLRGKLARYKQGHDTAELHYSSNVNPSLVMTPQMDQVLSELEKGGVVSAEKAKLVALELQSQESEYSEAVLWAFRRYVAQKYQERGASGKEWKAYHRVID